MRLCLAGTSTRPQLFEDLTPLYILESFYYIQDWQIKRLNDWEMFLLDSGAFTFMNSSKKEVNWNKYVDRYIDFINENNIEHFFELDIDSVVGYDRVKELRERLETGTGKKCIPVWHISRGVMEYKRHVSDYDYIAIGGLVTKEITRKSFPHLKKLVFYAKQHNTKVHGLGFTGKDALHYGFYSVDSTSWLSASRFGTLQYFDGRKMVAVPTPKGKKGVHYKIRDKFVFREWIKYQHYLRQF